MGRTRIHKDMCRLTTNGEYTWHNWGGSWGIPWYKCKGSALPWLIILLSWWRLLDWGWWWCFSSLNSNLHRTISNLMAFLTTPITSSSSHATLTPMLLLTNWACRQLIKSTTSLTYDIPLLCWWIFAWRPWTLPFWTWCSTCTFYWPLFSVLSKLRHLIQRSLNN